MMCVHGSYTSCDIDTDNQPGLSNLSCYWDQFHEMLHEICSLIYITQHLVYFVSYLFELRAHYTN